MLAESGVELVTWYGVRLFTEGWTEPRDGRSDSGRDLDAVPAGIETGGTLDDVFAVEFEASRRDPYRQLSRLFHLIGIRR